MEILKIFWRLAKYFQAIQVSISSCLAVQTFLSTKELPIKSLFLKQNLYCAVPGLQSTDNNHPWSRAALHSSIFSQIPYSRFKKRRIQLKREEVFHVKLIVQCATFRQKGELQIMMTGEMKKARLVVLSGAVGDSETTEGILMNIYEWPGDSTLHAVPKFHPHH